MPAGSWFSRATRWLWSHATKMPWISGVAALTSGRTMPNSSRSRAGIGNPHRTFGIFEDPTDDGGGRDHGRDGAERLPREVGQVAVHCVHEIEERRPAGG